MADEYPPNPRLSQWPRRHVPQRKPGRDSEQDDPNQKLPSPSVETIAKLDGVP